MKKIILILALMAVLFTACTMRSGNIPNDTIIGWQLAYNVHHEIFCANRATEIVVAADKWLNAANDQQRYDIEDTFFDRYNIRISPDRDTINIDGFVTILTHGKPLTDDYWSLSLPSSLVNRQTLFYRVKQMGNRSYATQQLKAVGDIYYDDLPEYYDGTFNYDTIATFTLEENGNMGLFRIEGGLNGTCMRYLTYYNTLTYEIQDGMYIKWSEGRLYDFRYMTSPTVSANIDIEVYVSGQKIEQDHTQAVVKDDMVDIYFRNYHESYEVWTEFYNMYY